MPVCYLCQRLDREADRYPQGRDKATGRPIVVHVYPNTLRQIRHVCDAPTQGERANLRREAAAELEVFLHSLPPTDARARALVLVTTIRTNG